MGNKETQESKDQQFEHPRLGNIKIIAEPNSETFNMEYCVPVNSDKELQDWIKEKKKIQNAQTNQVLFLASKHNFEKEGLCGSSGIVRLIFEQYVFLLDNEIRNRREINRPFLETEIWYLAYNILRAGKQYEKHKQKIGDVQPSNIVINEDGQIKIISKQSWPNQLSNFERVVESRDIKAYLAPEQCVEALIKKGEYPSNLNPLAAQAFSIGVTLLESATLQDCSVLYIKHPQYTFNLEKLKGIQQQLKNKYSQIFVKLVLNLLQPIPHERPTCGELHSIFSPYEEEILNLQQFNFDRNLSEKAYQNHLKAYPKGKQNQFSFNKLFENKVQLKQNVMQYPFQQAPQIIRSSNNYSEGFKTMNFPQINQPFQQPAMMIQSNPMNQQVRSYQPYQFR